MNLVELYGNIGWMGELRRTPSGTPVLSFSLAVRQYNGDTLWVRCTAWGKTAQLVNDHLGKGSPLVVVGHLEEPDVYTTRDGEQRVNLNVTADRITFVGSRNANQQDAPTSDGATEEDIPF